MTRDPVKCINGCERDIDTRNQKYACPCPKCVYCGLVCKTSVCELCATELARGAWMREDDPYGLSERQYRQYDLGTAAEIDIGSVLGLKVGRQESRRNI